MVVLSECEGKEARGESEETHSGRLSGGRAIVETESC